MTSGSMIDLTLNGRLFAVTADADPTRDLGGFTNTVEANGDGSIRVIQVRKPWKLEGITISFNDDQADQEFVQDLQDSGIPFAIAASFVGGTTYQGVGQITEDIGRATQAGTGDITLMGGQKLTQQS